MRLETLDEMIEADARAQFAKIPGVKPAWDSISDIAKIIQRQHALKRMGWRRRLLGKLGTRLCART